MKDVFKFTVTMFILPAGLFLYTLFFGYPPVCYAAVVFAIGLLVFAL